MGGAKKNKNAKVILAVKDPNQLGVMKSTWNNIGLVNPVGSSRLKPREDDLGLEKRCVGSRYATIHGYSEEERGYWTLVGSAANHKRYLDAKDQYPGNSTAEVVKAAGGTFYGNSKLASPIAIVKRHWLTF